MRNTDKSCEFLFVRCFAAISGQHMHRQLQLHAPNRLSMLKKYGNSWRAPGEAGEYWNG